MLPVDSQVRNDGNSCDFSMGISTESLLKRHATGAQVDEQISL